MPKVHIGSDHAGLTLKNIIKEELSKQGVEVQEHGTTNFESCDYPVFAHAVCEAVLADENSCGILVCGTGIGMSLAANKHKGIRAALCSCEFHAKACREHNNANVLCLGERVSGVGVALEMVNTFLNTEFAAGRHAKRVDLIEIKEKD